MQLTLVKLYFTKTTSSDVQQVNYTQQKEVHIARLDYWSCQRVVYLSKKHSSTVEMTQRIKRINNEGCHYC